MRRAPAPAKLNLALVVGPRGAAGKHELCTVYQRIDLCDRVELEPAPRLAVRGRRNEPAYVTHTLAALASARGETLADLEALIDANATACFRL